MGGLAFPHLHRYYQAAQLRAVASWVTLPAYNRWTQIDKLWMAPIHPNNLLWNSNVDVPSTSLLHTMNLLRTIWRQLNRKTPLQSEASLLMAFHYHPKLPDSLTSQMIAPWLQRNLFHNGHLVNPVLRVLLPFDKLRTKHDLPRNAIFGYLQIRHYAVTFTPTLQFSKPPIFECLILSGPTQKGLTSDIYKLLHSYDMVSQGKRRYMRRWEDQMGEEMSVKGALLLVSNTISPTRYISIGLGSLLEMSPGPGHGISYLLELPSPSTLLVIGQGASPSAV